MTISPAKSAFSAACEPPKHKKKRSPPFSIRWTDEERARLDQARGVLSLAAYIRLKVFAEGQSVPKERKKLTRKHYSPSAELAVISQMLGNLGGSRLASNMNQIAKAANIGALPVSPELERELLEACTAIQDMRRELITALGVKSE